MEFKFDFQDGNFRIATEAGDIVQAAGLAAQHHQAAPSSPLTQFLEVFQK